MAMNLMPLFPTLIQKGQLKKSPNVSPITRKRNEKRHIGSIILDTLSIRVKINCPIVPTNRKDIRRYVFPNPDPFRKRVPSDLELVRAFHCFGDRCRRSCRRFRWGRWRWWIGRWFRGFSENLTHARATVKKSRVFFNSIAKNFVDWMIYRNEGIRSMREIRV